MRLPKLSRTTYSSHLTVNRKAGTVNWLIGQLVTVILVALTLSACSFPWQNNNKIITLHYWGIFDSATTINQIIEDYKKTQPNVNIIYDKKSPQQYRQTLQSQLESGKGPDIFQFHNTWTQMLGADLLP